MPEKIAFSKRYAHGTASLTSATRAEIERVLMRFGATGFAFAVEGNRGQIMFEAHGRRVRFDMPDPRASLAKYGAGWSEAQIQAEHRRLWRSMLMAIKSKLEIVESGITTFEVEFLPYVMLDNHRTFADAAADPIFVDALAAKRLPPMLMP